MLGTDYLVTQHHIPEEWSPKIIQLLVYRLIFKINKIIDLCHMLLQGLLLYLPIIIIYQQFYILYAVLYNNSINKNRLELTTYQAHQQDSYMQCHELALIQQYHAADQEACEQCFHHIFPGPHSKCVGT
jgi:hypothetical protein